MSEIKYIGIEIDKALQYKLHHIAKEEERSERGQIKYLIKQYIREFEKTDGEIVMPLQGECDEK